MLGSLYNYWNVKTDIDTVIIISKKTNKQKQKNPKQTKTRTKPQFAQMTSKLSVCMLKKYIQQIDAYHYSKFSSHIQ